MRGIAAGWTLSRPVLTRRCQLGVLSRCGDQKRGDLPERVRTGGGGGSGRGTGTGGGGSVIGGGVDGSGGGTGGVPGGGMGCGPWTCIARSLAGLGTPVKMNRQAPCTAGGAAGSAGVAAPLFANAEGTERGSR